MSKEPNVLLEEYLKLRSNLQVVYVIPMFTPEAGGNNYLQLLYQPFNNQNNLKNSFKIQGISVSQYPTICFKRLKGEKSILHMHWYDFDSLKKLFFLLWRTWWILVYRLFGGKVVWTVHNKYPHYRRYRLLNKVLRFIMARIANRLHVHCNKAINIMSKVFRLKRQKFFVYPHPLPEATFIEQKTAQHELSKKYPQISFNENEKVFLIFGLIAEYKGIEEVIDVFAKIDKKAKLLIVGKTRPKEEKYAQKIANKVQNMANVIFINEPIPQELVPLFFNACDAIILNYKDILTSGVYYLASSYNKTILAVAKGCLKEAKGDNVLLHEDISGLLTNISTILS